MRLFGSASSGMFRRRLRSLAPRRARQSHGRTDTVVRITRRPPAPPFWRDIAPELRRLATPATTDAERTRYWRLVLDAKNIPWRLHGGEAPLLYVPPASSLAAIHEITAFETEKPAPPMPRPHQKPGAFTILVLFALLAIWHRLRWDTSLHPSGFLTLPAEGRDWLEIAGLNTYRVTALHEWWRCVTALTLHANAAHLVANIVTGSIFCIPLCRYTGVGLGCGLIILAGALGNAMTALARPTAHLSQGFSTAVFASVGLLAAIAASLAFTHTLAAARTIAPDSRADKAAIKQALFEGVLPLGAGLGLLAIFGGSDSPRVDYLAHSMGLAAGVITGFCICLFRSGLFDLRGKQEAALQAGSLVLSLAFVAGSWLFAIHAR